MKCNCDHLKALLSKNWIIWKRTPILSSLEILAPIILMLILTYLRSRVTVEIIDPIEFGEISVASNGDVEYTTLYYYPIDEDLRRSIEEERQDMEEKYAFTGVIPRTRLFFLPKACFWTGNVWT